MKTKQEYDQVVNDLRAKLGDDFAKVSDIVADLSTDYDSVIQNAADKDKKIEKLNKEKVKLLETNNNLFTKVTNNNPETTDPIIEGEKKKQEITEITIDDVVNEKGELE